MSDNVNVKLCILWENELREASRLLKEAEAVPDGDDHADERVKALSAAYSACLVALWGLDDNAAAVLVGNDALKRAKATGV